MLAVAEHKGIEPMLAVTKSDLAPGPGTPLRITGRAGYSCLEISSATGEGAAELREQLLRRAGLVVFSGNTGAGKSSLLNALEPELAVATGEVSEKLGRGRPHHPAMWSCTRWAAASWQIHRDFPRWSWRSLR